MSKSIKSYYISVISDDAEEITRCNVAYEVASSLDASLKKTNVLECNFEGEDLTCVQAIIQSCVNMIKSEEGIE